MGLGIMGSAMAANIQRAGYPLMVFNRSSARTDTWAARGVGVASSPKALAQATEVIILMVTGPEAIDEILWGPQGAAAALNERKVLINMSSVSPQYTRDLQQKLDPLGVSFIDAPVSGTKKPAEDGTLLILAGGPEGQVAELTPLLSTMGKKVIYCGEAGQGSMMKMAINLLLGIMMTGLAETVNFGLLGGLSLETILEVIFSGPLNCGLYQMKADMLRQEDYPPNFPLKHMTKDSKFILDTAYQTGAPTPLGQMILHLFRQGVARGWGDADFAAVARVLQYLNPAEP
jgi:3-hydroxyisobutyrate dehydrogenase-like beta-hydroxyacid dehydrogenase